MFERYQSICSLTHVASNNQKNFDQKKDTLRFFQSGASDIQKSLVQDMFSILAGVTQVDFI